MMSKVLIAIAAFLSCAAVASAETPVVSYPTDVTTNADVVQYLGAARAYWAVKDPSAATTCVEQVIVSPIGPLPGYTGQIVESPAAATVIGMCTITLAPLTWDLGGLELCEMLTHEYGHTLGLPDEASPAIMGYDWARYDVPTCNQDVFGWYGLSKSDKRWLKENGLAEPIARKPHRCTKAEQRAGFGGWC